MISLKIEGFNYKYIIYDNYIFIYNIIKDLSSTNGRQVANRVGHFDLKPN